METRLLFLDVETSHLDPLRGRVLELAGYSIAFDRAWLRVHMPTLDGWLSHRMIDVSTVRELSKRWAPTLAPDATQAHRSMRDCEAACAELHSYRSRLWEGRS